MKPQYRSYTMEQLLDAQHSIDAATYPENAARLQAEIKRRLAGAEIDSNPVLYIYSADRHFESMHDAQIDLRSGAMVEAQHPAEPLGGISPVRSEATRLHLTQAAQSWGKVS